MSLWEGLLASVTAHTRASVARAASFEAIPGEASANADERTGNLVRDNLIAASRRDHRLIPC